MNLRSRCGSLQSERNRDITPPGAQRFYLGEALVRSNPSSESLVYCRASRAYPPPGAERYHLSEALRSRPSFESLEYRAYSPDIGFDIPRESRIAKRSASCNDVDHISYTPSMRSWVDLDRPSGIRVERSRIGDALTCLGLQGIATGNLRVQGPFGAAQTGYFYGNRFGSSPCSRPTPPSSPILSGNPTAFLRQSFTRKHEQTAMENSFARQGPVRKRAFNVLWHTAKFHFNKPDGVKTLQLPVDQAPEFDEPCFNEAVSDGNWNWMSAEIVDNPFLSSHLRPPAYRQQLRSQPWNKKRIIAYYIILTLLYTCSPIWILLLLFGSPFIIYGIMRKPPGLIGENPDEVEKPLNSRSRVYRVFRDQLWVIKDRFVYGPRVLAHLYVECALHSNDSTIDDMVLITYLMAVALVFGTLLLLCWMAWKKYGEGTLKENSGGRVWLLALEVFCVILFFPITIPYLLLEAYWALRTDTGDQAQRAEQRKARIRKMALLSTFPVLVPLSIFNLMKLWIRRPSGDGGSPSSTGSVMV